MTSMSHKIINVTITIKPVLTRWITNVHVNQINFLPLLFPKQICCCIETRSYEVGFIINPVYSHDINIDLNFHIIFQDIYGNA